MNERYGLLRFVIMLLTMKAAQTILV